MFSFLSPDIKKPAVVSEPAVIKLPMLKPSKFILVPDHILEANIQKIGVNSIGISANEYERLVTLDNRERYVAILDRVYHIVPMKWLEEGELAAKHTDLEYFRKASANFNEIRLGVFPLEPGQLEIKRAVIQVNSTKQIGCLENSKAFKKELIESLKNQVVYSHSQSTVSIGGNSYSINIKNLTNQAQVEQKFGLFHFATKIRLILGNNHSFFFHNRVCDNSKVTPKFQFTVKAIVSQMKIDQNDLRSHFIQQYLKQSSSIIFLGNKVVVATDKNKLSLRLKKVTVDLRFKTLVFDAKTYKNRTQCFRICHDSNISFIIPDGLKNTHFEKSIENDRRNEKPTSGNEFAESQPQKKISFREFLTQEGIVGLPDQLEETINPILAAFGCLKPIMMRRGIKPEKGIILYGPPGTGKTTFARKLAQYIKCPAEQISLVSATDLIGGVVGETEKNIRKLFEPAREAAKKLGSESPLFVIVIDEIESLCRTRNMAKNTWETTQVNQFLTEMDGLNQISNLLVIGMTNNIDLIDDALLRSGRFGTKVMISKPDASQRRKILNVYLKPLYEKKLFSFDVEKSIEQIVSLTAGYTGADIKGLVEKVNNTAFARVEKLFQEGKVILEEVESHPDGRVTLQDFKIAINDYSLNSKFRK